MSCLLNSVFGSSSGIGKWIVMRGPVLVKINSVWISLKLWSKYIREVPSWTIFSTNSHSVASWDLLNSKWIEWSNSSFERVYNELLMYQYMELILLACSSSMGKVFYGFRLMGPPWQWFQLDFFFSLTFLSYYISDLFIFPNNIINIIL